MARPCRWTNEAVSLDNFGGMRGVARCGESWRASVKRAGKSWGARTVKVLGYICSKMVKVGQLPVMRDGTKMVKVGELP